MPHKSPAPPFPRTDAGKRLWAVHADADLPWTTAEQHAVLIHETEQETARDVLDRAEGHVPEAVTTPSDEPYLICSCGWNSSDPRNRRRNVVTWWEHLRTAIELSE